MNKTDEFLANLAALDRRTDKALLGKKESCELLGISYPTLMKYYGKCFSSGKTTKAALAEAMTNRRARSL